MITSNRVNILAFIGILFLALNLRGPFTSLAPLLGQIMDDFSLTASAAGFLTALPLFSFAICSPLAAAVSRKLGLYPSLILALAFIAIGIISRSFGIEILLYLGTAILGIGIAISNVLLPVVVKVNFPTRISVITSLYIFTMGIGSTLGASLMVPISSISFDIMSGWQLALLFNLIFPVLALSVWLPKVFLGKSSATESKQIQQQDTMMLQLLKCPVAWQVALTIGLNSFTFYSFSGWLPKILIDLGFNEMDSGYIYGFLQFSTMIPGLLLIPILSKTNSQRKLISLFAFLVVLVVTGLAFFPEYAIFWVGLFGVANCSTFILGMSFVGLRTSNSYQAAALSGLSQSIGYALAATGPSLVGYLHTLTNTWTASLILIAVVSLICTLFANLAARDKKVL